MEQVMNFPSALPIKKRRFIVTEPAPPPVDEPASPPAEDIPLISMDIKQESNICGDATQTSDLSKSSAVEIADVTVDNSESFLLKPETVISDRSVDELNNEVNMSSVEEHSNENQEEEPSKEDVLTNTICVVPTEQDDVLTNSAYGAPAEQDGVSTNSKTSQQDVVFTNSKPTEQDVVFTNSKPTDQDGVFTNSKPMEQDDVLTNNVGADTLIVKQEVVNRQTGVTGGTRVLEDSEKSELPLEELKEPILAALDNPDPAAAISRKPDESSSSLLSLDVSSVKHDNNEIPMENSGSPAYSNRSNWDLNTNMDEWEGSATNVTLPEKSIGISESSNNTNTNGLESPLSNLEERTRDGQVGLPLNKGKHTLDEYSSSSSSRSLLPIQCKPGDSLGLSLGMPFRGRSTSGSSFFLSQKLDSANDYPKLSLQKNQSPSKIPSLVSVKPVKLEPVAEDLESVSRIGISMGSMLPLKRETTEKQSSALMLMSDRRSVKSEPIQERNNASMFENSVRPQQFGRVMQHQESTASSSGLSMPSTPQSSYPSRLSTESIISKDQSQKSFPCGELLPRKEICNNQIVTMVSKSSSEDGKQPMLFDTGNMNADEHEKLFGRTHADAHGNNTVVAKDEEKLNLSTEMLEEEAFGSDCESPMAGEKPCNKEEGEYEEGEVRTPLQQSAGAYPIEEKKTVNSEFVEYRDVKPLVSSGDQSTITSDYGVKSTVSETYAERHIDHIKECTIVGYDPHSGKNSFQKLSDNVLEGGGDEMRYMNDTIHKRLEPSRRQDVKKELGEGVSADGAANISYGTGLVNKKSVICNKLFSGKHESTFSTQEASISGSDSGAKDSSSAGNKSRIITLPRASGVISPSCTTSISNRLLTPISGKGRYSDLEEDIQPRATRNELYASSPKFFAKDRVHDLSLRNSRPSFMRGRGRGRGRGRVGGRFGTLHSEWSSDNDFASENYNGQSDYRARRHKQHSSSVDDGEFVYSNGYSTGQDGSPMFSGRRKAMNDGKFIRHLSSDDLTDQVYSRPQTSYEEFDGNLTRGTRNFPTMQRKVYTRVQSKSPVRARTRSPGPWSSRRRRSPEISQHRSPPVYRMRKMRSPDRGCFRDEMVSRRRESPQYVTRHSGDMRDAGSVPDHAHPRPVNSNRRSPQAREFIRPARREMLDTRERGDESVDERRKFIERRGPFPPFRQSYNEANEDFHFQVNDGPRAFRFCPDGDTQFVERNNMREREFGHIKNQPSLESRRPRDAEVRPRDIDDQDGSSYRPSGRVWHDDDFSGISGLKRRRF